MCKLRLPSVVWPSYCQWHVHLQRWKASAVPCVFISSFPWSLQSERPESLKLFEENSRNMKKKCSVEYASISQGMSAAQMPSFGSLRPCTESPGQEINCVLSERANMVVGTHTVQRRMELWPTGTRKTTLSIASTGESIEFDKIFL